MSLVLAAVLAQPLNLNLGPIKKVVCDGGVVCWTDGGTATIIVTATGGGGAPTPAPPVDAGYIVWGTASSGSTNERVLTAGTSTSINTATAGQIKVDVVSPVSTAGALAADPTDCGANQYATTIAANGNLTCAQVSYAQVSGTPTIYNQTVEDEGVALTQRTNVNFTGAGVTCTDTGAKTSCSIPGGGSGGTSPYILSFGGF